MMKMNMNMITQELNKKIKLMREEDFKKYIEKMCRVWEKNHHNKKVRWIDIDE